MSVNSGSTVWLLDDGRSGHWRQVSALAGYLPVITHSVPVRLRRPWRWFAPYRFPGGLAAHPEILVHVNHPPDVILSCGRRSALAARWLKSHFDSGPVVVQILDCGLPSTIFDWVIAPEHDGLTGANVINTIGSLNPVDASWMRDTGNDEQQSGSSIAVLLGGPSRHFSFSRTWFSSVFSQVCARVNEMEGGMIVVESRRTPGWVADILADAKTSIPIHRIPWVAGDPGGSERAYASAMATAFALVVSADSVNMTSEACASGKPVFLLGAGQANGKLQVFCDRLINGGYARDLDRKDGFSRIDNTSIPPTRCLRETSQVAKRLLDSRLFSLPDA